MKRIKRIIGAILPRAAVFAAIFVVVALGLLYYFGIFDISFIDRPEAWETNYDRLTDILPSIFPPRNTEEESSSEDAAESESSSASVTIPPRTDLPPESSSEDGTPEPTPDWTLDSVGKLQSEGYYLSDGIFDPSRYRLGKLSVSSIMPSVLTYRQKTVQKYSYSYLFEGSERQVSYYNAEETRYALELYMGYIIYDTGEALYILDSYANALITFDETYFKPAYVRDSYGRPLFYRDVYFDSGLKYENGSIVWLLKQEYYYLSDDGRYMIYSDYNDAANGRGLHFDYPAYYGIADDDAPNRFVELTTKIITNQYGYSSVKDATVWAFGKTKGELFTPYRYPHAFNFVGGYACVTEEDTRYEGKVIDALGVINSSYTYMFPTVREYYNSQQRYVIEAYLMPDTSGIENLGMFYFDHGLMRVRRQVFDYYNFTFYKTKLVTIDDTVLINEKGEVFNIPFGYELISYSNGILQLENNGVYGYMDYTGKWITDPIYSYSTHFIEGLAVIGNQNGEVAMIDTDGDFVIPFGEYSYISTPSSGVIVAYSEDGGWDILHKMEMAS